MAGEIGDRLLAERFRELVEQWKVGRKTTSDAECMAEHPAYQQIISMGWDAVPLIVAELEKEPDHWFVALHAITGASPVSKASRGKLDEMSQAWIDWWRDSQRRNDDDGTF